MKLEKITQESWVDALVDGWLKHKSLGGALLRAANATETEERSLIDWDDLIAQAGKLKPKLAFGTRLKQPTSVWIASHCMHANNALWDGKIELAKKHLRSGKDVQRKSAFTNCKAEIKRDNKDSRGLIKISARERDDRSAWNKVK